MNGAETNKLLSRRNKMILRLESDPSLPLQIIASAEIVLLNLNKRFLTERKSEKRRERDTEAGLELEVGPEAGQQVEDQHLLGEIGEDHHEREYLEVDPRRDLETGPVIG